MAQLNDLLVLGSSKLLNGLGVLGTANTDSILPNVTDTYVLGESGKRWKSAYIKSIVGDDLSLGILTVTNYATIGAGQAATATNTGALRISGGLSTTQKSYFGASITTNSAITSSLSSSTHLAGNNGTAIINSTAAGNGYNMLAKMNSTNGVWTLGGWTTGFYLFYTTNSTITAGTNTYTKQLKLMDESGNSTFPGTVTAPTFSGALSGNASTATTLQTARTINGTSFNGSGNITTTNWGTARTLTIGNTGKSVNGSGNVSWTIAEIGALALTGGTVTGTTTFSTSSFGTQLWVERSGSTNMAALGFKNSNGALGYIAMNTKDGSLVRYKASDTSTNYPLLDSANYTSYTVTKTGSGASGTWGISISGNAATATTATSASYLKDKGNNTATYVYYSSSGMTSASWYAAWDGYTLRAISPANLATHLATNTLDARYALPARLGEYNTSAMTLNTTINGWYYASSGGPFEGYHSGAKDYMVMCQGYSSVWGSQIATDFRSNHLAVRNNNNGTWSSWALMLDTGNYSSYALPITGGTLTGLLGITANGNTLTLGSQNASWCHFNNSADINFYFNKAIHAVGGFYIYDKSYYFNSSGNIKANTVTATTFDGTASSAHYATRARYLESPDTRAVTINPSSLSASTGVQFDFKQASAIGLTAASYSGVMSYRPYSSSSDWTGGPAHQIAYNSAGLYWRQSSNDTTWGSWRRIMTSANFSLSGTTLTITTT